MLAAVFRASLSLSASRTALVIFLNKERNAVGALNNVLPNPFRQSLVACDAVNHCDDFAVTEPIETECGNVGPADPERLELRPISDVQQHTERSQPLHCATERFKARWVDPMHILENHQHWLASRQRL